MEHLDEVMGALGELIQGLEEQQHVSLRYYKQVQTYFQKTKQTEDVNYILERLIAIGPVAQYQYLSPQQERLFNNFLTAAQNCLVQRQLR